MSIIIIIAITLGTLWGYFFPSYTFDLEKILVEPVIYALVFLSGIEIGYNVDIKGTIRKIGIRIFTTPLAVIIGSITGGILAGFIIDIDIAKSSAISSGLGWYSLSGIMASKYDAKLGAMTILCNVFRELLSFLFIPLIAKYIGYIEAIAPCGATSMDTTLTSINKYTDEHTSLLSFANGVILMVFVPVLVQSFLGVAYGV